jgi:hypothetical protein
VLHHFVREPVAHREIQVSYTATDSMVADVLTKALAKAQHEKLSGVMGLVKVEL